MKSVSLIFLCHSYNYCTIKTHTWVVREIWSVAKIVQRIPKLPNSFLIFLSKFNFSETTGPEPQDTRERLARKHNLDTLCSFHYLHVDRSTKPPSRCFSSSIPRRYQYRSNTSRWRLAETCKPGLCSFVQLTFIWCSIRAGPTGHVAFLGTETCVFI